MVYGQKSYAHCSLFSDAEWIAHSEQLCHSSQHPSLPPSHPSVTLHGVQRHHVGLCDRPHMAATQWQCSLSPQLWHHHPAGLQEHGCHERLRPFGRCLGSLTVLGALGGGQREKQKDGVNNIDLFIPALSRWTNLNALQYLWKTCRPSRVPFWMPTFSCSISASRTCLHRTKRTRVRICKGLPVRSDLSRGFTSEEQCAWAVLIKLRHHKPEFNIGASLCEYIVLVCFQENYWISKAHVKQLISLHLNVFFFQGVKNGQMFRCSAFFF